ncbi:centromere protein R isoform X2 [Sceloporus undulatus]|uniref:centromere protein R isoform X2 n=1 Tax=Sceloporus undulatus TaxID=8520 RepID=UPI001C4ABFDB|nr:centromere protein R isoform X2 [Sceloporus undulatus]
MCIVPPYSYIAPSFFPKERKYYYCLHSDNRSWIQTNATVLLTRKEIPVNSMEFPFGAKRALKLDKAVMEKRPATPLVSSKKNLQSYSPTTGTCLLSPFSSPKSNNVQEHRNGLSNENRGELKGLLIRSLRKAQPQMEASEKIRSSRKGQANVKENDKLLMLHSAVEDSLERFMHIRQSLTSLQALEGIRELENIIGASENSGNLKDEVRKTRKLIEEARKQKLLRKSNVRFPTQDYHRPHNSFAFLKSLID